MRSLILIGRCGKETLKKIFNEEEYTNKDFNYLKTWILRNYKNKILSAENSYDLSKEIEILFSFVNRSGEEEDVNYFGEKIINCYFKSDGRIYWRYKIVKYIEPVLGSGLGTGKTFSDSDLFFNKPSAFNPPGTNWTQPYDQNKPPEFNYKPSYSPKRSSEGIPTRTFDNHYSPTTNRSDSFSGRFNEPKSIGKILGQMISDFSALVISLLKAGFVLGSIVVLIILVIKFLKMWWSNWMLLFK